jgi:hypothetical protein
MDMHREVGMTATYCCVVIASTLLRNIGINISSILLRPVLDGQCCTTHSSSPSLRIYRQVVIVFLKL